MASCFCRTLDEDGDFSDPRPRAITYWVQNLPVGLFDIYLKVFEKVFTDVCSGSRIMIERQNSTAKDQSDPFTTNDVDISFMSSSRFVRLMDEGNKFAEFLAVLPLFRHPVTNVISEKPYYYSQVIIHQKKINRFKYFEDLQGHTWGMNHNPDSFTGNIVVLAELRKYGSNSNFFGNLIHTGSHVRSIEAVVEEEVDGAAVDSNVLQLWLGKHPEHKNKVHVLCTWGPWPLPPIVVNSRLPAHLKNNMAKVLLNIRKDPELAKMFEKFGIYGFVEASPSIYDKTREILKMARSEVIYPPYY